VTGPGGINGSGGAIVTGGTRTLDGGPGSGGIGSGGIGSGGIGTGGIGTGGIGTGGIGTGGTAVTCTGSQKLCNGACIATTECCGGCSGNTPVCNNGTCVGNPNGTTCTAAAAAACVSGICADGVCCDATCTGQCEACNTTSAKGTCSPTTTPRTACTTDASYTMCGGTCDGTAAHRLACNYPSSQCVAGSCVSGTQTYPRMCDGTGHCGTPTPASRTCSPYTCADTTTCATGCSTGQDTCGGSSCVPLNTDTHCGNCSNNCTTSSKHCSGGSACVQCTADSHCSGTTPKCNTSTNTCVGCLGSGDCPSSMPICYTNTNTCVECTGDGDCSSTKPHCSSHVCYQCTADTQCSGTGSTCVSNQCQCRKQSATNVLTNGGFDSANGRSGWLSNEPCGSSVPSPIDNLDTTTDSDNCPGSGSLRLSNYQAWCFGQVVQCLNINADRLARK
jgi:hypothetical protein